MDDLNASSPVVEVLVVDDVESNLLTLQAALESSDYQLVKVASGAEALRYLLANDPALILMDVQMPHMDGFETVSAIKSCERTRNIPIIFLTAIGKDEQLVHKGYEHGAVDYMYKPYDIHVLRSKVSVFVDLAKKTKKLVETLEKLNRAEVLERERLIAQLELKSLKREQVSQRKFLDLVDGITHGIVWSADFESLALTFVSPSARKILGFSEQQWMTEERFFAHHTHPADRDRLLGAIRLAQSDARDVRVEHRFVSASGSEVWLHTSVRVVGEPGQAEIRGLSVDITKIKEAEATLERNKRKSDFLADASLLLFESMEAEVTLSRLKSLVVPRLADWCFIHLIDDTGVVELISVNHADPAKIDLASQVVREDPLNLEVCFGPSSPSRAGRSAFYPNLSDLQLRGLSRSDEHMRRLKTLGVRSAMVVPMVSRGRIFGTLTLCTAESGYQYDRTDLSMAEDVAHRAGTALDNAHLYRQTRAAVLARDEFLCIASHELKTPLTPLKIQIQAIQRILRDREVPGLHSDALNEMLRVSDRQVTKLNGLVDNLLDISRINEGRLNLDLEPFDLNELIIEVCDRFREQLALAKCELKLELSEQPSFWGDRLRFEQVVVNLLTNAMKYGAAKEICISSWAEGGRVGMSVQDRGVGIAALDQERIFERFERAASGSHFGGLGLGLYIVRQIVEAHGGVVSVRSILGEGSIFTVDLPAEGKKINST